MGIVLRRQGQPRTRTFSDGSEAKGYDITAVEDGEEALAGFAVRREAGKKTFWIVLDPRTGIVLLGPERSTSLGNGLGDCLRAFKQSLGSRRQ